MRKINLLTVKSYLGPLLLTFFIALFILDMQFLWKYVDDLVGKGLEWQMIGKLLFYATSTFVPMALPLAILLSSLMTFGNLGEHYELVAMKAAGISLKKIMMPLVVVSIIISISAFYFSNNVLPGANLKFQSLLYDIRKQKLAFNIKEGIFYNGLNNYTIRIGKKDSDGIHISDVMIYNHSKRLGNINVTTAKTGKMETTSDGRYIIFTLNDGCSYQEKVDVRGYRISKPFQRTNFKEQYRRFDLKEFELSHTNEELFKDHYLMLNLNQLKKSIDTLAGELKEDKDKFSTAYKKNNRLYSKNDTNFRTDTLKTLKANFLSNFDESGQRMIVDFAANLGKVAANNVKYHERSFRKKNEKIVKHWVVWHKKFTLSFACFVLFFIGAPLGAIIRKGGLGLPVVISVLFFIIFHITSITGEKYARAGVIDPAIGMWISSVVLLPIGIFLTYKATSDSPLLDTDSWRKLFNRIIKFKQ